MPYHEDPPRGAPLWCVSFGDMMALLLGFFILLYALSGTKKEKDFDHFAAAMQKQFGLRQEASTWFPGPHKTFGPHVQELGSGAAEEQGDDSGKRPTGTDTPPTRLLIPAGSDSHLGVIVLFPESSAELPRNQLAELRAFADQVRGKRQKIEIRGHASGKPPAAGATYRDAWDLAYQRSYATMQFLVRQAKIDPERIRLSTAGPNERFTAVEGLSPEAARSRVEVFLLDEMVDDRQENPPAAPADWTETEPDVEASEATP
jgi:chemotaxis protein MotB